MPVQFVSSLFHRFKMFYAYSAEIELRPLLEAERRNSGIIFASAQPTARTVKLRESESVLSRIQTCTCTEKSRIIHKDEINVKKQQQFT